MLKFSRLRRAAQRGDTIVEVLVVLAVLGLSISVSYATANRSLLDARQAQENSQASSLAEAQIEALRSLVTVTGPGTIFQPGPYCISQTAPYSVQFGANCTVGGLYNIAITYTSTVTMTGFQINKFQVVVTWPDVQGPGNDTVTLFYRFYAP